MQVQYLHVLQRLQYLDIWSWQIWVICGRTRKGIKMSNQGVLEIHTCAGQAPYISPTVYCLDIFSDFFWRSRNRLDIYDMCVSVHVFMHSFTLFKNCMFLLFAEVDGLKMQQSAMETELNRDNSWRTWSLWRNIRSVRSGETVRLLPMMQSR